MASYVARRRRRRRAPPGLPQRRRSPLVVAMLVGAALGRHRRRAQGDPRRQRGDLDDHAERDRDDAGRLPAQHATATTAGNSRAHHADPGEQPARRAGRRSSSRDGAIWTLGHPRGRWSASAFSVLLNRTRFGFDLRATGMSETAAVASGVKVEPDGRHLDAAVRRRRRPDLDAGVLRRRPLLRHDVPGRPRLHRHRRRAARSQPAARDRVRCAAVRLPQRAVQPAHARRPTSRRTSSRSPRASSCSRS